MVLFSSQRGSGDLSLAQEHIVPSSWKKPHHCQRRTRERLLSVLSACGPFPVLMSSPSVSDNTTVLVASVGETY